jgi:hypothetical protein
MRKSLLVLLAIEFVVAFALGQAGTLRRSGFDHAFMEWYQHPTAETRQELDRQKRITELWLLGFSGVVFAGLAGSTILVYWLRKGEPDGAANGSQPIRSVTNRTSSAAGSRR